MKYKYGDEVGYEKDLLTLEDRERLQAFSCGNETLDRIIHTELLDDNGISNDDGLIFTIKDVADGAIIAIVSLAASGIMHRETNYSKLLPAVKIDIFAVDENYQKMHMDKHSESDPDHDNHYYLSDSIMDLFITQCNEMSEKYAIVQYIILYADRDAYRFYERNAFEDFAAFMEPEHNQEINENIPMYMKLM